MSNLEDAFFPQSNLHVDLEGLVQAPSSGNLVVLISRPSDQQSNALITELNFYNNQWAPYSPGSP